MGIENGPGLVVLGEPEGYVRGAFAVEMAQADGSVAVERCLSAMQAAGLAAQCLNQDVGYAVSADTGAGMLSGALEIDMSGTASWT